MNEESVQIRQRVYIIVPESTLKKLKIKAIELGVTQEQLISAILRKAIEDDN